MMERITITLPEEMKGYIEREVASGQYGNVSEYLRDLVRHEQERKAIQTVEKLVLNGIRSGESKAWTENDVQMLRDAIKEQANKRKS